MQFACQWVELAQFSVSFGRFVSRRSSDSIRRTIGILRMTSVAPNNFARATTVRYRTASIPGMSTTEMKPASTGANTSATTFAAKVSVSMLPKANWVRCAYLD